MRDGTTGIRFRGRTMRRDRALIMAIVNRTPDSSYDRGATFGREQAPRAVERAVAVADRLVGSLAVTAVSAWEGAVVFRAHNVAETRQVLDMVAVVSGRKPPAGAVRGWRDHAAGWASRSARLARA